MNQEGTNQTQELHSEDEMDGFRQSLVVCTSWEEILEKLDGLDSGARKKVINERSMWNFKGRRGWSLVGHAIMNHWWVEKWLTHQDVDMNAPCNPQKDSLMLQYLIKYHGIAHYKSSSEHEGDSFNDMNVWWCQGKLRDMDWGESRAIKRSKEKNLVGVYDAKMEFKKTITHVFFQSRIEFERWPEEKIKELIRSILEREEPWSLDQWLEVVRIQNYSGWSLFMPQFHQQWDIWWKLWFQEIKKPKYVGWTIESHDQWEWAWLSQCESEYSNGMLNQSLHQKMDWSKQGGSMGLTLLQEACQCYGGSFGNWKSMVFSKNMKEACLYRPEPLWKQRMNLPQASTLDSMIQNKHSCYPLEQLGLRPGGGLLNKMRFFEKTDDFLKQLIRYSPAIIHVPWDKGEGSQSLISRWYCKGEEVLVSIWMVEHGSPENLQELKKDKDAQGQGWEDWMNRKTNESSPWKREWKQRWDAWSAFNEIKETIKEKDGEGDDSKKAKRL